MSKQIKKSVIVLAIGAATAMTGLAFAQPAVPLSAPVATLAQAAGPAANGAGERAQWLNLGQIHDRLIAAGYTDVREIERERDGYEAKARNPQGAWVKLYIEPVNGNIVREKVRDDD
ncbi:MAG TPA: PepSY domain-containing protein [Burkholderiaceae bacterium]|nr:PepSY domain-containing protein [Burkholderiaceae bacterium]